MTRKYNNKLLIIKEKINRQNNPETSALSPELRALIVASDNFICDDASFVNACYFAIIICLKVCFCVRSVPEQE